MTSGRTINESLNVDVIGPGLAKRLLQASAHSEEVLNISASAKLSAWLVADAPPKAARLRFNTDANVHGSANPLVAAEIALGGLHRDLAEQ
jgi:hypothetical protein